MTRRFLLTILSLCWMLSHHTATAQQFGPPRLIDEVDLNLSSSITGLVADLNGDARDDIIVYTWKQFFWAENLSGGELSEKRPVNIGEHLPYLMTAGDLDGDGSAELFYWYDSRVYMLKNGGTGYFNPPQSIITSPTGTTGTILVTDINNDGNMDVVAGSEGKILFRHGDGSGGFADAGEIDLLYQSGYQFYPGDIDGDGDNDIVFAFSGIGHFGGLVNDGTGNLDSAFVISNNVDQPSQPKLIDTDLDGDLDIVLVVSNWRIRVYLNDGQGQFAMQQTFDAGLKLAGFADLTADGITDLIVDNASIIAVYEGIGNGEFDPLPQNFFNCNVYSFETGVGIIDLYEDGYPELCLAEGSPGLVAINNVNGMIAEAETIPLINLAEFPHITADIDNDGDMDLVPYFLYSAGINWYENDGQGGFSRGQIINTFQGYSDYAHYGDLNGDGAVDIVLLDDCSNELTWLVNDGEGAFTELVVIDTSYTSGSEIHFFDAERDGDTDMLVVSEHHNIDLYVNESDGLSWRREAFFHDILNEKQLIEFGDLEGDGDSDILVTGYLGQSGAMLLINDGSGAFNLADTIEVVPGVQTYYTALNDLDGDGDPDLVRMGVSEAHILVWAENTGGGQFNGEEVLDTISSLTVESGVSALSGLYIDDLDQDGDNDIVYAYIVNNTTGFEWLENLEAGQFGHGVLITSGIDTAACGAGGCFSIYFTQLADFNDDGYSDFYDWRLDRTAWYVNLSGQDVKGISGRIFWDRDEDGIYGSADRAISGSAVELLPEGGQFYTGPDGVFQAYATEAGSQVLKTEAPFLPGCTGAGGVDFIFLDPPAGEASLNFVAQSDTVVDFILIADDPCRNIGGFIYEDVNENGIHDAGEGGVSGVRVVAEGLAEMYSRSDGSYSFYLDNALEIDISLDLSSTGSTYYCAASGPSYSQTSPMAPDQYTVDVDAADPPDAFDFGVVIDTPAYVSLSIVSLVVYQGNVPGTDFHVWMDFKTHGVTNDVCILRIDHDSLLTLLQASITPTNIGANYVEWVFTAGNAPAWHCMQMDWHLDEGAQPGDVLHWEATYNCVLSTDVCPQDNVMIRDIEVIEGPGNRYQEEPAVMYSVDAQGILPELIGNEQDLSYVLTFRNPLSVIAYDIYIIDTLPEELDILTVSQPFASFPYNFYITDERVMVWEFDGIDLNSAETDETGSYGFVQFNVKQVEGLAEGTEIHNHASVFFNGNHASASNDVRHRLAGPTAVFDDQKPSILLFPNPASREFRTELYRGSGERHALKVYDITGRPVLQRTLGSRIDVDCSQWPSGIYILEISDHTGSLIGTKLLSVY